LSGLNRVTDIMDDLLSGTELSFYIFALLREDVERGCVMYILCELAGIIFCYLVWFGSWAVVFVGLCPDSGQFFAFLL
jgi:hypothetical protein